MRKNEERSDLKDTKVVMIMAQEEDRVPLEENTADAAPARPTLIVTGFTRADRAKFWIFLGIVAENNKNVINPYRDRGLNPGPSAQKFDTLPLDHQVTCCCCHRTKR
uniref:Uncharacterized protein n=1 Tax=Timema bartmani TaxID=61472 RepID=A0A7R9I588_9NEOP|nr:unnamed protein product [Timema bartmani]